MSYSIKDLFVKKIVTPEMIAAEELRDARMDLLKAQKEREYWSSMVPMLEQRIVRLKHFAMLEGE